MVYRPGVRVGLSAAWQQSGWRQQRVDVGSDEVKKRKKWVVVHSNSAHCVSAGYYKAFHCQAFRRKSLSDDAEILIRYFKVPTPNTGQTCSVGDLFVSRRTGQLIRLRSKAVGFALR